MNTIFSTYSRYLDQRFGIGTSPYTPRLQSFLFCDWNTSYGTVYSSTPNSGHEEGIVYPRFMNPGKPSKNYQQNMSTGAAKLIINYLPQDMTNRELHDIFGSIGPIESSKIVRDFKTGYSYGYAFVSYRNDEHARRAISIINGMTIRNKILKVSFARPGGSDIKDTNLYITNLPTSISEEQFDVIFGEYGNIVQRNILRDKATGLSRGVAFVRYTRREEAQTALAVLNNSVLETDTQPISVKLADNQTKAKAQNYMKVMGISPYKQMSDNSKNYQVY